MDTRIPYFEGQKDFLAFLRFLDNRKEFDGYIKTLDTKIAAFLKAAKLYGKAKDIEKKHEEAELWVKRAEFDYGERGKKLVEGEKTLAEDDRMKRAVLLDIEQRAETARRKLVGEQKDLAATLKAREAEVGKRENAILARENRAQEAQEAAEGATQAADAMVVRMQAATA